MACRARSHGKQDFAQSHVPSTDPRRPSSPALPAPQCFVQPSLQQKPQISLSPDASKVEGKQSNGPAQPAISFPHSETVECLLKKGRMLRPVPARDAAASVTISDKFCAGPRAKQLLQNSSSELRDLPFSSISSFAGSLSRSASLYNSRRITPYGRTVLRNYAPSAASIHRKA